jgi:hypothetical protein
VPATKALGHHTSRPCVIRTGVVMGRRPTQGDEKRLQSEATLLSKRRPLPWKRRPHLCHLDRSEPGFPATRHRTRPRVRLSLKERRMKFANATNFNRKSGAAQWRDLCVDAPSWKCFFDRVAMGRRPTQGDEKRLGPATTLYRTVALPFVIPSEAEGSAVPRTFRGNVFRPSAAICGSPIYFAT